MTNHQRMADSVRREKGKKLRFDRILADAVQWDGTLRHRLEKWRHVGVTITCFSSRLRRTRFVCSKSVDG